LLSNYRELRHPSYDSNQVIKQILRFSAEQISQTNMIRGLEDEIIALQKEFLVLMYSYFDWWSFVCGAAGFGTIANS